MPDSKKKKGYRVKRKSPPKNVRKSKAYKVDQKRRKGPVSTAGFRFGRTTVHTPKKDKSKQYAGTSVRRSAKGANEAQVRAAVRRMKSEEPVSVTTTSKSTLGNRVVTIKKKKRRSR